LEQPAHVVVKGRADLRDADPLALEVPKRAGAGVVQVLPDDERGQVVVGPLATLVGDDPDRHAARDDVVEPGREPRRADLEVARGDRDGDRLGRLEEDELGLDAELLEVALLGADEQDRGRRQPEHAELHLLALRRGLRHPAPDQHGHQQRGQTSRHDRSPRVHGVFHGSAARSSRTRTQCAATPSRESRTIPTMSFVVSMRFCAWRMRKPMPALAAIISAATSRRSAVPAPSLRPAKIIGSAEGSRTLRMRLTRPAPKLTAARIRSGSAVRTPVWVLIAIGKKTPSMITATFDASPIPSQRIRSGSSAIFGIGKVPAISDQMRSTAAANSGLPRTASTRGRSSSTGTAASTRPGRRERTTTRSARYTASWMLCVT